MVPQRTSASLSNVLNPDVTYGYPPEIWPLDPGLTPQSGKAKEVSSQAPQKESGTTHDICTAMESFI